MIGASHRRRGDGGGGFPFGLYRPSAQVCESAAEPGRRRGRAKGRPGNAGIPDDAGGFRRCCRRSLARLAFIALMAGSAVPASAGEQPQPAPLGEAVMLMGANSANDALSRPAQPGPLTVDLYFLVRKTPKDTRGRLCVTEFVSQSQPASAVDAAIRSAAGRDDAAADKVLPVSLAAPGMLHVKLTGGTLRPGATYKGWLFLIAGEESAKWEMTLTAGSQGIIAALPVGAMKFTTFPPFSRLPFLGSAPLGCGACSGACMGNFPITLRDKSDGGPYHRVRVFFESSTSAKADGSNFSLDAFSFWERTSTGPARIDLERYAADARGKDGAAPPPSLDLDHRGQRTLIAAVKPLAPGEYTGTLRFGADESQDDAPDAKLSLTILVRHHWMLPVLVILLGSLVGWYSSKYVVGVGKARKLARQVRALGARADAISRYVRSGSDWEFPGEGTSYGMVLVRVMLSQLALLTSAALPILVREEEIQQQYLDAEARIAALQSLHDVRLKVQLTAGGRPAAQKAIGRLLRRASDMIEQPAFGQAQQDELATALHSAEAWLSAETANKKYREALVERLLSRDVPSLSGVQRTLPEGDLVRQQLEALLTACPTAAVLTDSGADTAKLEEYDLTIAKLAILWRDRKTGWAKKLAAGCAAGESLADLYQTADGNVWETLRSVAKEGRLTIDCGSVCQEILKTYDIAEIGCRLNIPEVPDMGSRIVYHPLRVGWKITSPDGTVRSMETRALTLAQYFPRQGKSTIEAVLRWQGEEIPLTNKLERDVAENPEYSGRRALGGGLSEWATLVIAAGFAMATAMGSLYDYTFGTLSQYLTLFLWAAGAGTGGNMFKQLGTASLPGGQADVPLPPKPAVK